MAPSTVIEHFHILEDTLLGFKLEPWMKSKKRKAIMTAKFYFFDCGVTNAIAGIRNIERNSDLFGKRFEQSLINEVRAYHSYSGKRLPLFFWREKHGREVDLLIGDEVAIEFKAAKRITPRDLSGIRALKEEHAVKKYFVVSNDQIERVTDGIRCVHHRRFLEDLWAGRLT